MEARFEISYRDKAAPPRYTDLESQVKPFAKDVAFRWSHNGVPHLLVELGKGVVYSVCYFGGTKSWTVFYPYGSGPQMKQKFSSVEDVIKFLKRHRPLLRGKNV